MTSLLLMVLLAQKIDFEARPRILLQRSELSFERISVSSDYIFVRDEGNSAVLVFDHKGQLVTSLGEDTSNNLQLPYQVSWLPAKKQLYVYDAATRGFLIWQLNEDRSFQFLRQSTTEFDLFFEVGHLIQIGELGFAAPVSLVKEKYLVGRFDQNFNPIRYGYEIMNRQLTTLSPVLRQSFMAKVKPSSGERLLTIQSLNPEIQVFDTNLTQLTTISVQPPGWKEPNMRKLKRVSKNPRELEKLKSTYSEVIAVYGLDNNLFLVGYRNVRAPNLFTYQCYDANTGEAVGQAFETAFWLVANYKTTGYYLDKASSKPELYPIEVVKR